MFSIPLSYFIPSPNTVGCRCNDSNMIQFYTFCTQSLTQNTNDKFALTKDTSCLDGLVTDFLSFQANRIFKDLIWFIWLNFYEKTYKYFCNFMISYHFSSPRKLNSFFVVHKNLFILHMQYHGCCYPEHPKVSYSSWRAGDRVISV